MKQTSKLLSLLLAAALCAGPLCLNVGAEASGGASSTIIPEDASQGTVHQEGDMVFLTLNYGTVVTFTSASLGGSVSFPSPETGEMMTLKTIIARPGCVAYATSASGQVYTEGDEGYENMDAPNYYENYGRLVCHYYGVQPDGTLVIEGMNDGWILGNTYARFGLETPMWDYSVFINYFYADDGAYWITTQEELDLFSQLTGYQVEGGHQPPSTQVFRDVAPDAWYADYVQTVYEKNLFTGKGDGLFAPDANMTYAEFLVVLSQFSGETIPASDGAWYQGYVDWAQSKELIPAEIQAGFAPNASITRQDMAALFGAFLNTYSHKEEMVNTGAASFADQDSIASYAREGVEQCYALGIMGGNPDGTFAPQATATRAQVAVTIVQMARVMDR